MASSVSTLNHNISFSRMLPPAVDSALKLLLEQVLKLGKQFQCILCCHFYNFFHWDPFHLGNIFCWNGNVSGLIPYLKQNKEDTYSNMTLRGGNPWRLDKTEEWVGKNNCWAFFLFNEAERSPGLQLKSYGSVLTINLSMLLLKRDLGY